MHFSGSKLLKLYLSYTLITYFQLGTQNLMNVTYLHYFLIFFFELF